jgi:carbon-monoxide dehydrogenase iron sulfur subunit
MAKDEVGGRVANHLVQCVGCWMCVMNCPYGATVPSTKKSIKCDYCLFGEAPSCVRACPTKALVFCEPQEYERRLQVGQKWRERG